MTQESQNPEPPKPPESPQSAWAPRPTASEPPPQPAATGTPDVSATPASVPPTLAGTTIGPASPGPASPVPEPAVVATPVESAPSPAPRRSGVPVWLFVLAAIVPAVIASLIVFFVARDGGGDDDGTAAAGIVDGLISMGQADQDNISSYAGELPPDFATDFPLYEGAEVVVSVAIASEQGTGYLIVMSTPDPASEVFSFYSDALDQDPWQVEIGRASAEFTGLRFLRPDNIDVSGDVSLHRSDLSEETVIYLSYSDISQAILPGGESAFTLGPTRPLPLGFPEDIPIYSGAEESVILDTYFERGQGGRAYIVRFLTRDSQDAVIEFYRDEFEGRGWVVSDSGVSSTSFALAIEFDNGPDQSVAGTITADSFDDDPQYTQVDLLVTTSNN